MDGKRFDRLAKVLSIAGSRRALAGLGVGALTGLLGWRETDAKRKANKPRRQRQRAKPQRIQAQGNPDQGNDACAHFCNEAFPPGPDRGACKSQAAQGEGPCYECGPPGDPDRELCGGVCCQPGEDCVDDRCQASCTASTCNNQVECDVPGARCYFYKTTAAECLCVGGLTLAGRSECSDDSQCHFTCSGGFCQSAFGPGESTGEPCGSDADCAFLNVCDPVTGHCGGSPCIVDADCARLLNDPGAKCLSGAFANPDNDPSCGSQAFNTCAFSCG